MQRDLTQVLKDLGGKALARAAARALNKGAASTRTEMVKRVRATIRLKAKDVREVMSVSRAKAGPVDRMKSKIIVQAKAVELVKFGANRRRVKTQAGPRVGVTVNVKGQRKLVKGAFLATMKNGKVGVFMRGKRSGSIGRALAALGINRSKGRLPIRMLFSSSVQQVVSGKEFQEGVLKYAGDRTATILEQEINFEYSKLGTS